jgi:hypothetical protein
MMFCWLFIRVRMDNEGMGGNSFKEMLKRERPQTTDRRPQTGEGPEFENGLLN